MPKHIHRFYKQETHFKSGYMWKCTECGWFVHAGLEYVMVGKSGICWSCDSVFTVDNTSLNQAKPKCLECLGMNQEVDNPALEKLRRRAMENKVDEIHKPDCDSNFGGDCSCQ